MFKILYQKRAEKQLDRIHPSDQDKVLRKIEKLALDPFDTSLNIRMLANTRGSWRMRIGDIRIIYKINIKEEILFIELIGYRGNIYKKL